MTKKSLGFTIILLLFSACNSGGGGSSAAAISCRVQGGAAPGCTMNLSGITTKISDNISSVPQVWNDPFALTTDGNKLYLGDLWAAVYEMDFAGPYPSTLSSTGWNRPRGVTTLNGYLYVADSDVHAVKRFLISDPGTVTTIRDFSSDSPAAGDPWGITTDGTYLYVTVFNEQKIVRMDLDGDNMITLNDTDWASPAGITTDGVKLYATDIGGSSSIKQISITGGAAVTLSSTGWDTPFGITTDGTFLYVTDSNNSSIKKILIAAPHTVSTIDTGSFTWSEPLNITTDGTALYVSDNGFIAKIE